MSEKIYSEEIYIVAITTSDFLAELFEDFKKEYVVTQRLGRVTYFAKMAVYADAKRTLASAGIDIMEYREGLLDDEVLINFADKVLEYADFIASTCL